MSISAVPTFDLEESLAREGHSVIVGFDEVGRGSLAGPVMVGAAAFLAQRLPQAARSMPHYLADSKMLTVRRREALYEPLQQWADAWAVGSATSAEIDEWGISHALGIAALRALDAVERTLFGAFADAAGTPATGAEQTEQTTLVADWDAHMPRVGAILTARATTSPRRSARSRRRPCLCPRTSSRRSRATSTAAPWRARPCSRRSHATA